MNATQSNRQTTDNWVVAKNFDSSTKESIRGVFGRKAGTINGIPVYVACDRATGYQTDWVYGNFDACGSRTGIIVGGVKCIDGVWYVKRCHVGSNGSRRIIYAESGMIAAQAFNVRSIVRAAKKRMSKVG